MNTSTFRLKKTDSELFYALLIYMNISLKNERLKIDRVNRSLSQICSLEEAENNVALCYEIDSLSEKISTNQPLNYILHNDLTKK